MIYRLSQRPAVVLACLSMLLAGVASGAHESQKIVVNEQLQIPGAVLKQGVYTFSVEDRLQDRAIVRITAQVGDQHYLALTVPNRTLRAQPGHHGLALFNNKDGNRQILKGWVCPGCSEALEFVYPKLEAAKITSESAEAVLAVDPTSDKLPENLSAEDLKVVTLWLLSPKRITADNQGKGLTASKYQAAKAPPEPIQKGEASPTRATTEIASASTAAAQPNERLPKTSSNAYTFAFWGMLLVLAATVMHRGRVSRASR